MTYRRRYRLTRTMLAAVSLAFIATVWPAGNARPDSPTNNPSPSTCWEDEPCWDCFHMGNHVCGPTVDDSGMWWPCWAGDYPCEEEG